MERGSRGLWKGLVLGVAVVLAAAVPSWGAPPSLSFEASAVVVSGVTSGGSVAVMGVSRGFNGFTGYYLRTDEVLTDADGDGSVRLELELPLSEVFSVWAAVDVTTGELGLGAPEGTELVPASGLPAIAVSGDGTLLTAPVGRWAYTLWVRPGQGGSGVWGAVVGDGGSGDEDGAEDGSVSARVSTFAALDGAESAVPASLVTGDVVVVVDPETFAVETVRL